MTTTCTPRPPVACGAPARRRPRGCRGSEVFMPNPSATPTSPSRTTTSSTTWRSSRHRQRAGQRGLAQRRRATTASTPAPTGAAGSFAKVNPQGGLEQQRRRQRRVRLRRRRRSKPCCTPSWSHRVKLATSRRPCCTASTSPSRHAGADRGTGSRTSGKLAASGSRARRQQRGELPAGRPGLVQQLHRGRPEPPDHVYVGLEEVYETTDGGSALDDAGPYWNFGLRCWAISDADNSCPQTTHPDQHSIAIAGGRVYVGNDGGV